MRKTAFLSTLVVLWTLSLSNLSAQAYTYILYDANSMDRLDHQFLGTNSAALYTSYRLNKNTGEQIFLDIGIESPIVFKQEPPSMVSWQNANIDQNFVMGINTGNRKVFICKKLDSGWAVQAIGSGVYMSNIDRVLTVVAANYDFRADLKQALGNNLSMKIRVYLILQMFFMWVNCRLVVPLLKHSKSSQPKLISMKRLLPFCLA